MNSIKINYLNEKVIFRYIIFFPLKIIASNTIYPFFKTNLFLWINL